VGLVLCGGTACASASWYVAGVFENPVVEGRGEEVARVEMQQHSLVYRGEEVACDAQSGALRRACFSDEATG
jgi:hypothetical protein